MSITAWAKKVWKDRQTEYPTRRTLTKTDGSQEIVTVARNEGAVSQEGDAFSAENMNDLEERIDAGFTEITGKLNESPRTLLWENADTTKSFAAQTITLPDSDYAYFEIYSVFATSGTSNNVVFKHTLLKNHIAQLFFAQYESGSIYCDKRRIISNNENISITDNYRNASIRNDIMIPYMIYGCRS